MKDEISKIAIVVTILLFPVMALAQFTDPVISAAVPGSSIRDLLGGHIPTAMLLILVSIFIFGFFMKDLERKKTLIKIAFISYWTVLNLMFVYVLWQAAKEYILAAIFAFIFLAGLFTVKILFQKNFQAKWWAFIIWIFMVIYPILLISAATMEIGVTSKSF